MLPYQALARGPYTLGAVPPYTAASPWGDVSADESQALRKVSVVLEGKLEGKREMPLLPYIVPRDPSASCPEV